MMPWPVLDLDLRDIEVGAELEGYVDLDKEGEREPPTGWCPRLGGGGAKIGASGTPLFRPPGAPWEKLSP